MRIFKKFFCNSQKSFFGGRRENKSLISNISLDDDGNLINGYFVFVKPKNYTISDTYDIVINGTFEHCEPVVAAISIS